MFIDFQEIQSLGTNQFESASAATAATAKGLQAVSAEVSEFTRKRFESGFAFGENLLRARKLDEVVQLQTNFARDTYNDLLAQAGRFSSIFSDFAKEAFSPKKGATLGSNLTGQSATPAAKQSVQR